MFCMLFQNLQHYWKNNIRILKQIAWETQKCHSNLNRPHGSSVIDQNNILIKIYKSRTVWPTKILMPFWSFSDSLLQYLHIIFQKCIDDLEITHKTYSILVWDAVCHQTFMKILKKLTGLKLVTVMFCVFAPTMMTIYNCVAYKQLRTIHGL